MLPLFELLLEFDDCVGHAAGLFDLLDVVFSRLEGLLTLLKIFRGLLQIFLHLGELLLHLAEHFLLLLKLFQLVFQFFLPSVKILGLLLQLSFFLLNVSLML